MADTSTRRRVKLYMLNDDRLWDDRGTGHVSSVYVERLQGMSLLVRSESDASLLLESKIQPDTAYQKQQETLIVWSEADNYDLALSFQEKAGCDEIWEKICSVQGKDPSVDITQDVVEESEDERFEEVPDAAPPIDLPPCELSKLDEISELFTSVLPSPIRREKLSVAIESEGYIKKLVELFHMCEDLENVEGLHHLYDIFKSIFLLNKNALFEIMFADDMIHDIVGVLEYDPSLPQPAKHRDYLRTKANFKEVIPLNNADLVQKIHQTYRVQYIQDVILPTPSVFEENMLSTLNSFIFFNKVEIVSMLQEDEKFLRSLFDQLVDDETDDGHRRDLVLFLKEFCTFSQILQPASRDTFFKTLSEMGILKALETILGLDDDQMKAAAIDIFSYIVEFSPPMVREFILQEGQKQDDEDLLINLVIDQLISDSDPELGGAVQLMGIIRLLIDPENMLATANKTEKTEFLGFFYKHSMHVLTAPLFAYTVDDYPSKDDYQTAQLLSVILELLTFCIEHHTYHIKNYVLTKDLLRRVLVLLKSKHAFLALGALRLMRRVVGLKDEFYNRYLIRGDLFKPVVDAFLANGTKYNLLNSAMIEMFEFVRIEDIKTLTTHIVESHIRSFESVDYVQTFKNLKQRYEQLQDRMRDRTIDSFSANVPSILRNNRYRRDARSMEEEEEMWFEGEDELEDGEAMVPMSDMIKSPMNDMLHKSKYDPDIEQINKILEKRGAAKENEGKQDAAMKDSPPKLNNRTAMTISFNISSNKSPPSSGAANNSPTMTPACSPVGSPVMTAGNTPVTGLAGTGKTPCSSPAGAGLESKTTGATAATNLTDSAPAKRLIGLVDYPDEDSDEEEEDNSASSEAAPAVPPTNSPPPPSLTPTPPLDEAMTETTSPSPTHPGGDETAMTTTTTMPPSREESDSVPTSGGAPVDNTDTTNSTSSSSTTTTATVREREDEENDEVSPSKRPRLDSSDS